MGRYSLQIKQSVAKDLRAIPKKDVRRILKRIEALAEDPRELEAKKLTDLELYRIRIGPCRVLHEVRDDVLVVIVIRVAHRSGAYS